MLLFHLKCLSLQTSTYNLGRAEWRTSKVSKPLPILFLPDDNFLIYSYILFSATFVKQQNRNKSRTMLIFFRVIGISMSKRISSFVKNSLVVSSSLYSYRLKGSFTSHSLSMARNTIARRLRTNTIAEFIFKCFSVLRKVS